MSNTIAPMRIAIAGCGNIATKYTASILNYPESLQLVGAFDVDGARAEKLASEFGGKVYATLDELLADEDVETVVNLTVHQAHVEVITHCLEAGKHVYTEKPLALDPVDAQRLVELAEIKGLRLASAPMTFLGNAQQEAMRLVQTGIIGTVRMVYADMNWDRIEVWHPAPKAFFDVGPVFDVAVYPLTILTALFGSVERVQAFGGQLLPERVQTNGDTFTFDAPDWACALLQFSNGVRCRITASFYTGPTRQEGIEFHGDEGTLHLTHSSLFNAPLNLCMRGSEEWILQPVTFSESDTDWARGLVDMAQAFRNGTAHQTSAARAAHVVDIAAAVHRSISTGESVELSSRAA
jgi:predicted dehydrogenase